LKIVIATPFYEMKGFSPYISSLAKTLSLLHKLGIECDYWDLSGDSYVDRARNTIANEFMKTDATHLIFIDSDMAWDLDGFGNLLQADVDIVGAGYPCKNQWDFYSCILNVNDDELKTPKVDPKTGLISAWGVPTGFMKIRREVFLKLAEKMPDNKYECSKDEDGKESYHYNFFGRIPPMGEDISFCRRWVSIGGELWVEPRVTITHFGVKGWEGNYHEFLLSCPGGSNDPLRKVAVPA
jgi:hypothetical protein